MNNCLHRLSKPVAWVEGECFTKDLVQRLVNEITEAHIPKLTGGSERYWEKIYAEREHDYVTYTVGTQTVNAQYTHEDGNIYPVYQIPERSSYAKDYLDGGLLYEVRSEIPVGNPNNNPQYRTGKSLNYDSINVDGEYYDIEGGLAVVIDLYPDRTEATFDNVLDKYQAYLVKHSRIDYEGNEVEDFNWNSFKIVTPLPDDWTYALRKASITIASYTISYGDGTTGKGSRTQSTRSAYRVNKLVFTPTLHEITSKGLIRLQIPQHYDSEKGNFYYYLYIEKPLKDNNYLKVSYIVDYEGLVDVKNIIGDPEGSYRLACTISNKGVVTVVDELEAYYAYERQIDGNYYKKGHFEFRSGSGMEFTEGSTIISYWFMSSNSTLSWLPNKMRDEYSLVRYSLSISEEKLAMVLEGDPSYDPDSAYTSFAYAGAFRPINANDDKYNFALTTGMGIPIKSQSGFDYKDINKEQNPVYARYGRFTSNGMDTVSVFKGKSGLLYQEYRPAFLTHLPNYPTVGTLPKGVSRLQLGEVFQPSEHTDHFHSSPIYLVHGYEGYRGYLDGVVAIYDRGVVLGDEMDYHIGGYIEEYKVFKIDTPISFLDKSPAPKNMILLLLKDIVKEGE